MRPFIAAAFLLGSIPAALFAQGGGYEIQVYGSELVAPGDTMFELHSNYTAEGYKTVVDGVLPDNGAEHETLEITHGWNDWFETGFYQFTSIQPDGSWDWVGTHIRPRIAVPASYGLPVGLSLSAEFGYQRPNFSPDTWTLELRPIIDQKKGKLYWAFNPTFDKSFRGYNQNVGYVFSPNVKASYDVTKRVALGFEYYGAVGPVNDFFAVGAEEQQLFPAIDLDLGPNWEFNFGVGVGMTGSTEHLVVKMILGYRLHLKKHSDQ